jgi:class 3 adenylate cyclase
MTATAPSGVVTFLFTDVEGSTRRWEKDADAMRAAMAAQDNVLRNAMETQGGWLFKHTGDGVCAANLKPTKTSLMLVPSRASFSAWQEWPKETPNSGKRLARIAAQSPARHVGWTTTR